MNLCFHLMNIKIDNSPNWYEYLFVALILLSFSGLSLQGIMIITSITLLINLLQYGKRATIVLNQTSFEVRFKTGFVTYRTFRRQFSKTISEHESITFYNDEDIVFILDVGLSYEENEAHSISLRANKKNYTLGNKKNCVHIFNEIKKFYSSDKS